MDHSVVARWGMFGLSAVSAASALYVNSREKDWLSVTGRVVELVAFKENLTIQVVDLDASKEVDSTITFAPRIEFTSRQGPVTFVSKVRGSGKSYPVGSTVQVLYNPGNPADAHIDSFWIKYQISLISAFFAIVCGLILSFG